jgi:hypothetical protein
VTRGATAVQKLSICTIYGLVLVLFLVERARQPGSASIIICMTGIVGTGCLEKLSTTCLAVSIEREWPSVISNGSSTKLATMNTWLRRTVSISHSRVHTAMLNLPPGSRLRPPFSALRLWSRRWDWLPSRRRRPDRHDSFLFCAGGRHFTTHLICHQSS